MQSHTDPVLEAWALIHSLDNLLQAVVQQQRVVPLVYDKCPYNLRSIARRIDKLVSRKHNKPLPLQTR